MRKILAVTVMTLVFCGSAVATTVTATVTDPNSVLYGNATYTITFQPAPGTRASDYLLNGATFTGRDNPITGSLNSSGVLSVTLTDNALVSPSGSTWTFRITSANGTNSFTAGSILISGTSISLTSQLSAAASPILGGIAAKNPTSSSTQTQESIFKTSGQTAPAFVYKGTDGVSLFSIAADGSITCTNCGTGTVTSSGSPVAGNVAKFTAATNIAPAAATDIVALFSTCSGTQYLGADGACHTASAAAPLTLASGGTSVPLTVNTTGTGDAFQVQQGGTTFLKFGANESITYGDAFGNTTQWKQTVGFFDGYSDSAASILMYRLNTITGTFQEYGGVDVSASNGVASIPGYDKKSAQTSAISATTLFTVGASDTLFHIHIGISCDSTSSLAVVTPSVIFTSINGSSTRITDALNSATQIATCTTLGAASEGSADYTFNAKAGTTIQYSIAITNTPTYSYRVALTKLGIN